MTDDMRPVRSGSVSRRAFLRTAGAALAGAAAAPRAWASGGDSREVLYNGIRLAAPWPPRRDSLPMHPILPPYLADPPSVIPIDVGRQLFVDDFLVEESTLTRTYHRAQYISGNPILSPTTAWERYDRSAELAHTRPNPAAMPFSDGVFYDPRDRVFKMWYMGGYGRNTCYAYSADGLSWTKPDLHVDPGTNIVWTGLRDSSTVWLDTQAPPGERYKMANFDGSERRFLVYVSSDGVHWRMVAKSGQTGDRSTFFYNPFRKVWVFSLRGNFGTTTARLRRYFETADFTNGTRWRPDEPVLWTAADALDPRRPEYDVPVELYNLDCVAYESLLLGLFTMWRGERTEREKPNDVCVGFSRDGFHWHRASREPFIPVSEHQGDWNWANVQSAGGCCLVVGDKLYFYVSGRRGVPGTSDPGICGTGLAVLRRDGFASLAEPAANVPVARVWSPPHVPSSVTTRPLRWSGSHLFVNTDAAGGEIAAEVLDEHGRVIEPFARTKCVPVKTDTTGAELRWASGGLKDVRGEAVRLRFYVRSARLYAFWVSAGTDGASGGYVAAGGPGFTGPMDTVGVRT